jgi:hypothetical protein
LYIGGDTIFIDFKEGFRNLANPINSQQLYVHYDLRTTG